MNEADIMLESGGHMTIGYGIGLNRRNEIFKKLISLSVTFVL